MKEVLKSLGANIRNLGFKGSGHNYRKVEDDYIFVINIQGSRAGDVFYINLGAQPTFIPAECDAALATLKEYECVMRSRVGDEWRWVMHEEELLAVARVIEAKQSEFFGLVRTLRSSIAADSVDELIRKFSAGNPPARATLHLARAAAVLGCSATANALIEHGLTIAGERATGLIYDLRLVRQELNMSSNA